MNTPDQPHRPELEHAWERRLDAELHRLPEREAPPALLSSVMAVVRAREAMRARAWWRRPATEWHPALRVSFGVLALGVFGGMILGLHVLWPELLATSGAQAVTTFGAKLSALWDAGRTVIEALSLAVSAILTPTRLAIGAAIILSQLLLLGAGGAALRASLLPRRNAS